MPDNIGANKHVIMSHGGKHGAGGTYLQGQPIPEAVQPFVPKEMLGRVAQTPAQPPKPTVTPQSHALATASVQMTPPAPAQTVPVAANPDAPLPPPTNPEQGATAVATTTTEGAQTSNTLPKNRQAVFLLTKEAAISLAGQLGLTFSPDETAKAIKEKIQENLGL